MFMRPHDGEQQIISNEPPRYLVLDDYNDATHIKRVIIRLPDDDLNS